MWRALALALATVALAARGAAEAGRGLSLDVSAAFGGWFRPGCPVLVRATLTHRGPALDGELDLTVEGITWRQPLRVGADTAASVDVLVVAASPTAPARARVRDRSGALVLDQAVDLGLRPRGSQPSLLVGVWGGKPRAAGGRGVALLEVDELPTLAPAYLALDALIVMGDGAGVPPAARTALAAWVHGGGAVAFALAAGAPVGTGSFLAELGGRSGRATAAEWLKAASEGRRTRDIGGATAWRAGLGHVAAALGTDTAALAEAFRAVGPPMWGGAASPAAPGLYDAFDGPLWSRAARWRLAGAALALLAAVVAVALIAPSRWGRWGRAACLVAASAALAGAAWALVLPAGRGVLTAVGVVECVEGEDGGRRTELVCVAGAGRGRVGLDLGHAEAVAPLYYGAGDAGSWRDVVVARDSAGRWTVALDVARDTRRCLMAWWPWERVGAGPGGRPEVRIRGTRFAQGEEWRPLRELRRWDTARRAIVAWQASRWGRTGLTFAVSWHDADEAVVDGDGLLDRRAGATLLWAETPAD